MHYSLARELWNLLLALASVDWVLPYSVRELLIGWQGLVYGKNSKRWQPKFVSFGRYGGRKT